MKIKITKKLPTDPENRPEVGGVYEVVRQVPGRFCKGGGGSCMARPFPRRFSGAIPGAILPEKPPPISGGFPPAFSAGVDRVRWLAAGGCLVVLSRLIAAPAGYFTRPVKSPGRLNIYAPYSPPKPTFCTKTAQKIWAKKVPQSPLKGDVGKG